MIPNLFSKSDVPKNIPKDMEKKIEILRKIKNKEKCLRKACELLVEKHKGVTIPINFSLIFSKDVNKMWSDNELHCNNMTYLLRTMLVKSENFTERDIIKKNSFYLYISPHTYLRIKVRENKFFNVDPWAISHGMRFGDYIHGFHKRH